MDEMIARLNIARFQKLIAEESNSEKLCLLHRLLEEQTAKLRGITDEASPFPTEAERLALSARTTEDEEQGR